MTYRDEPNPASEQQPAGADAEQFRDDPGADPGTEGIPEHADQEAPANRRADDPQRQAVPGEHPVAADDYGTTAGETRHGEPLAGRLRREEPDVAPGDVPGEQAYERTLPDEVVGTEAAGQADADADVLGEPGTEDPALAATLETDDPREESAVSVYDRMDRAAGTGAETGQLVAPDEGAHPDRERFATAREADRAVDGPEQSAVHDEGPGR